jgi:hypothetical protein
MAFFPRGQKSSSLFLACFFILKKIEVGLQITLLFVSFFIIGGAVLSP